MTKGVYPHKKLSKEHKEKIGLITKQRWKNKEFDKKLVGEYHPFWKGGELKKGKYIYVYSPNHPFAVKSKGGKGYIMKHRLIMEKHLGRYLKPDEVVHHIDGDIENNKIKNLELTTNSKHLSLHRLGKPLSEKTKEKLSKKFSGEGNPFYNKKHTQKTKDKIGLANSGKIAWNKGIVGKDYFKHFKKGYHFVFGREIKNVI